MKGYKYNLKDDIPFREFDWKGKNVLKDLVNSMLKFNPE